MSLFEDLVDELKEDNLLEETIIETVHVNEDKAKLSGVQAESKHVTEEAAVNEDIVEKNYKDEVIDVEINSEADEAILVESENIVVAVDESTVEVDVEAEKDPSKSDSNETLIVEESSIIKESTFESDKKEVAEQEFYRRRALDEVNGLEMVDHVLSGVEREMMKTVPKSFDNYEVKQALHEFLQVADDIKSPKHAEQEFALMKETEIWYSALAERDNNLSVSNLRRYCETTKPSLSSQALMSLARFYRNSPYSETVRSKFDLVVSKLFSNDIAGGKRELVFEAKDLIQHIQELYADWSSTPLYSVDEDDSELLLAALKFQDFISEAETAENFDELVNKDFFKRLKIFKEKTNENFFSPMLVAAAVESNVAVGNRFIDLIYKERDEEQDGSLSDKYGIIHDKVIADATSKTLELIDVLDQKKAALKELEEANKNNSKGSNAKSKTNKKRKKGLFSASTWLIVATIITVVIGGVYFITSNSDSLEDESVEISRNVRVLNLENSSLKEYVESAKISDNTMFAITNETWDKMTYADKQELVGKFIRTGEDKGFGKVHILNDKGETVAFGSKDGVNIIQ